jgi:S-adenosylmethionine-dependent methyltransferase
VGELELYSEHCIRDNKDLVAEIRKMVIETRFSRLSGWMEGGETLYARDIDRHTFLRHDRTVKFIVPWVNQYFPLADKRIVEIGCGTGSSTAAFAKFAKSVTAYDIQKGSIDGAKRRLAAHGLSDKAYFNLVRPEQLWSSISADHASEKTDILLLFALLEHQTLEERLETLRSAQEIVRPGGIIVVCETPNRLVYFDNHTSRMPFFHMLPLDLQLMVAPQSQRRDFRDSLERAARKGLKHEELLLALSRWGQGVSFHEFDLTFDDIDARILSGGTHPNLLKLRRPEPQEDILRSYMESAGVNRHPAFARYFLDLIIRV